MQTHSHLFLIAFLVFVFPLVFLLTNQSFFKAAETNINTAEKQRVGLLHDALVSLLQDSNAQPNENLIAEIQKNNPDIQTIGLFIENSDGYDEIYASSKEFTFQNIEALLSKALNDVSESLIFETQTDGVRQWTVVRKFTNQENTYYLVTDHSFATIDSVLKARKQQSYLVLTLIFGFLLALTYWLAKQIHWQREAIRLQNVLDERNLFTNMIAHEFRAPLTVINGYSSFLIDAKLPARENEYVENIQTSTERLLLLVNDFLEVARIQSGKLKLSLEEVSLDTVFEEVVAAQTAPAAEKGLELRMDKMLKPVHFVSDRNRLIQVLTNLVSNAIKYTESGSITLSVEQTHLITTITIKDTGTGISATDQKKLFAPFVRVGGVENTGTVGTGLGMWITKQLVELLGGEIGVESIKGVGTHVVVTFTHKKLHSKKV